MIVGVKNLGPLEEAQVDLSKQLIVLAGPNSSGKTYLAWSVYGLFRPESPFGLGISTELLGPCIDKVLETSELDPRELVRACGQAFADRYAQRYTGSAYQVFAVDPTSFTQTEFMLRLVGLQDDGRGSGWNVRKYWTVSSGGPQRTQVLLVYWRSAGIFKFGVVDMERAMEKLQLQSAFPREDTADVFGDDMAHLSVVSDEIRAIIPWGLVLAHLMADLLFRNCVIFPAERIATSIFAKELSLKRFDLVERVLAADEEGRGDVEPVSAIRQAAQRYPWPIRDSLRVASDLERLSRERSEFEDLADEMEKEIVSGQVKVGQYGQLAFSPAGAPELELGIHVTASVVKSLSSLVFYFRHMAKPGDFLIIDEPELNLHPDNQRKVARLLAKAVNRGFKIMISSHSDYLMRELDNLIMLSQPTARIEQLRERLGYAQDELLRPEQLGVYLFKDGRATEVEVTDTGFSIETIDQEINGLNEVSQEIYTSLFQDHADEP